jgi:carbamoyltransferase
MNFLGISFRNHDANLSYSYGNKIKYIKFEREFNQKHFGCVDYYFIQYVLDKWKINILDIDAVAYVTDMSFIGLPHYSNDLIEELKPNNWFFKKFKCPFFKLDHHFTHMLSLWPLTDKSDVEFVLDGMGDFEKTYSIFKNKKFFKSWDRDDAESMGRMLGSLANSNNVSGHGLDLAGKLMGLKSYGKINYDFCNLFENNIEEIQKLFSDRKYYAFNNNEEKNALNRLASIHYKCENIILDFFKNHANKNNTITYSGGIAQNSVINGILKKEFPNLIIPPHCPDDGLSLGLIEFLRTYYKQDLFEKTNFPYWQDDIAPTSFPSLETINKTAELLASNKIVGWYQGHGELGPRALGNRSILMNPLIKNGKEILNNRVKKREWFRPFGATILEECVSKYFNFQGKSEYMLFVTEILEKEKFPSITHTDNTCRIQTLNYENNNFYYLLLNKFFKLTGIPILLNTSLNINGSPICSKPFQALQLFQNTELDALVIGNELYIK